MEVEQLTEYANLVLTWIGFGTVVGLAAKAIMPGRDPGGTIATLLMGISGTLIGCALLKYFYPDQLVKPISLEGFAVGSGGAFVLLLFYKILGGYVFIEGETSRLRHRRRRRRSYRQLTTIELKKLHTKNKARGSTAGFFSSILVNLIEVGFALQNPTHLVSSSTG